MVRRVLTRREEEFLVYLYQNYYDYLKLYSYAILDKQYEYWPLAEDCVQMTFEKAIEKMNLLQSHETPFFWLKKTCRYITLTEKRKLATRARILRYPVSIDEEFDVADPKDAIADWILSEDLSDRKQLLMDNLTEQERLVYKAIYEEELSYREAEEKYGISDGTLRGAMQRIKRKALKTLSNFSVLVWCIFLSSRNL